MDGTAVLERLTWQAGDVIEVRHETPRVSTLVIEVPGWRGHRAGQHVDVRLTAADGYQAVRSYSLASAPGERNVALTVERLDDGEVSPYLSADVQTGDRLEVRGPIGGYFVWDVSSGGPLFLVGGGSGIVPLMAILRHRLAAGSDIPLTLLYSARSPEDVIYRKELDQVAADDGIAVTYTFTRSQPPGWTGYDRRIDEALLNETGPARDTAPLAYVCGPTQFVETAATALLTLGYEPGRVKTERFGPTGR
ncbi:MAG: ferredoxin reductase [Chloroflexota bacterium]